MEPQHPDRFASELVAGLDEPVQRYFNHALRAGAPLGQGVRLRMEGRIKAGIWMPFRAEWQGDGRSFEWRARAGRPFGPIAVVDRYADADGSMDVRLLGRIRLVDARGEDTTRSAAGRAAVEAAVWAPACLLPSCGVEWRAEGEDHIVAAWDVPPERPEVHIRLDGVGAPTASRGGLRTKPEIWAGFVPNPFRDARVAGKHVPPRDSPRMAGDHRGSIL